MSEKAKPTSLLDAVRAARGDMGPEDVPVFLERFAALKSALSDGSQVEPRRAGSGNAQTKEIGQ
jgi:hypothetical protein